MDRRDTRKPLQAWSTSPGPMRVSHCLLYPTSADLVEVLRIFTWRGESGEQRIRRL